MEGGSRNRGADDAGRGANPTWYSTCRTAATANSAVAVAGNVAIAHPQHTPMHVQCIGFRGAGVGE